jgi:hypothetical protein
VTVVSHVFPNQSRRLIRNHLNLISLTSDRVWCLVSAAGVWGLGSEAPGPGRGLILKSSRFQEPNQPWNKKQEGVKDDSIIRSAEGIVGRVRWVERGEEEQR